MAENCGITCNARYLQGILRRLIRWFVFGVRRDYAIQSKLTLEASPWRARPPTHWRLTLAPMVGYRSHAFAPSIYGSSNTTLTRTTLTPIVFTATLTAPTLITTLSPSTATTAKPLSKVTTAMRRNLITAITVLTMILSTTATTRDQKITKITEITRNHIRLQPSSQLTTVDGEVTEKFISADIS